MTRKLLALAASAALLAATTGGALAQSSMTPGHKMQEKGSISGSAGASGYAPGHKMQEKGSVRGTTGASGYAPGHKKSGASINGKTDIDAGGAKAGAGADIDVK